MIPKDWDRLFLERLKIGILLGKIGLSLERTFSKELIGTSIDTGLPFLELFSDFSLKILSRESCRFGFLKLLNIDFHLGFCDFIISESGVLAQDKIVIFRKFVTDFIIEVRGFKITAIVIS